MSRTLVIADHNQQNLSERTLSVVTAAVQIGNAIDLLIVGHNISTLGSQASKIEGVECVLIADSTNFQYGLAENTADLVTGLANDYSHILAANTSFAKNFLPRVAALTDSSQLSEVVTVVDSHTFVRPVYAGTVLETVRVNTGKVIATVRTTAFEAAPVTGTECDVITLSARPEPSGAEFITREVIDTDTPDLTTSKVVISGGRGLKSKENFDLLYGLAKKFSAAVGSSRAAVDAGFAANEMQVGQTGKVVAPDVYFAVGISGAIQHIAGMKDSKTIIAINSDPDAPIFKVCDFGIVGDLFEVIPEIESKL
ncbi:electron transfer flavoprotein subunit alpha/FixB family protein [Parasalinivibrio latis]|uniref:electron transfer flavoprotein subunit alpha/FixB family protein n=1 Tax=Parasalinivibrio latis TaxID=2952610 RepID=UPI003DA47D45